MAFGICRTVECVRILVAQACILTLVVLPTTCTPISKDVFSVTFPWMHIVRHMECINHQEFYIAELNTTIGFDSVIPVDTFYTITMSLCVVGVHMPQPASRSERQTFLVCPLSVSSGA